MINLLKVHMLLFGAGFSAMIIYTDTSYDEIGLLLFFCALSGATTKPAVCSLADRYRNYKDCLMISLSVMLVCTLSFAAFPFRPKLFFEEPRLRFNWYLMASIYFLYYSSLHTVLTLNDVYVVDKCSKSSTGEHSGQYKCLNSVGWTIIMFSVACMENVGNFPYLALPMLLSGSILLIDIIIVSRFTNIKVNDQQNSSSCIDIIECQKQSNLSELETVKNIKNSCYAENFNKATPNDIYQKNKRISLEEQLELLIRLNLYDNYNLLKYALALVIIGASTQIQYVYFLESLSTILKTLNQPSQLFKLNAVGQVMNGLGELCSYIWFARFIVNLVGRDGALMVCVFLSGLRYAVNGFFVSRVSIWLIAALDCQTGLIWGLVYNMMVETPTSYLRLLDDLLLMDNYKSSKLDNQLVVYLNRLRESHSDEVIRLALRATIQSVFSGSCEGIGFGLGPIIAGFWLSQREDSFELLFQDLSIAHSIALITMLILEFGLIRTVLGVETKIEQLVTNLDKENYCA